MEEQPDLRMLLLNGMTESQLQLNKPEFIPKSEVERLITKKSVGALVKIDSDFPLEDTAAVIAILIFSGHFSEKTLACLRGGGFTNECLPVTQKDRSSRILTARRTGLRIDVSSALDQYQCGMFCENQWRFLSPVLGGPDHGVHDARTALPIIYRAPEQYRGSFGMVCKIKVHPAHLRLWEGVPQPTMDENPYLAIKELTPEATKPGAPGRERQALEKIQKLRHKHLIRFVGSFEMGDTTNRRFYFLFPWASGGDLKGFWKDPTRAYEPRSPDMLRWVLSQIQGLARAIKKLHEVNVELNEGVHGRHGDLRPENILIFHDDPKESRGTLQITDAGLARFHEQITSKRVAGTSTQGGSVEYAPPEASIEDGKRGRRYDMWSLGCILLEFIVWILGADKDVEAFRLERKNLGRPQGNRPEYSPFHQSKRGGVDEVHPAVKKRVRKIRKDKKCPPGTFLQDLLDVIERGMLCVDEDDRFYGPQLTREIDNIVDKSGRDEYFWAPGTDNNFFGSPLSAGDADNGNAGALASPTGSKRKKDGRRFWGLLSPRRRD